MPVYEFKCPSQHVTTRVFGIKAVLPKFVKCLVHKSTTHSPGCAKFHQCNKRAARVEVYKIAVQGDLPTRGAF
jgi:hypothetical protein